jgi:uncharacterized protein (DUF427 family)
MKAIWNGQIIAESDRCGTVEGNYYFSPEAIKKNSLKKLQHILFVVGRA